jgi:hypothetical protein
MIKHKRVRKQLTWFSGETVDGYPTMAGVFHLVDGQGIPLVLILQKFKEGGIVVDWDHFLTETINKKWNWSTTTSKIEEAAGDIYGKKYTEELLKLCKMWYIWKGKRLVEEQLTNKVSSFDK